MSCRRFGIAIALTILLSSLQYAAIDADTTAKNRIDSADLKNIMLVKDIKPGMRGYGKSVFRGTKPETFQVEVLGVLKKFYFGTELILVKFSGGPMTTRKANLIEGMSGSPVYINGKIIGALAFGYSFGKEPMGMVTPIEYMLDAWDPSLPSKPSSFFPFSTANLDEPIALGGHRYGKVTVDYGQEVTELAADTLVFRPLATPILVSGMSPRIMSWLQESLKPLNVHPVAGPGLATDKADLKVDIQPGAAIGVSFVTGDIEMTGIGTVTYRRGDEILALGHPMVSSPFMNGLGAIQAPLTTAYVYDVYPSLQVSRKIAAPIKSIGCVFQDRPWSIGARIGELPEMIPVNVHVEDQSLGRKRDFRVKVVSHPFLASSLIVGATAEAVFQMIGSPIDATAKVKLEVVADEVGTITRENSFFDPVSIDTASVAELHQILSMLYLNPFHPVGVKKVNVHVTIVPKHQTAKLERIFLKESKFEPGDTVEVGAVLKPFKGEKIIRPIKLELPRNMPNGKMSIEVFGGGMSRWRIAPQGRSPEQGGQSARPPDAAPSMPTIENLQQLIKKFLERDKNDELVARIVLPKSAPSIAGEKLSGLPPSIADAMKSSKTTRLGTEREEIKEVLPTDWVIFGAQRLSITVQKTEKSEKKLPRRKPADSRSDEPAEPSGGLDEEGMDGEMVGEGFILSTDRLSPQPEEPSAGTAPAGNQEGKAANAVSSAQEEAAAAEEQPTEETEAKKPAPSTGEEKPVGRTPTVWKQTARSEFTPGTFTNVTATTGDLLMLAGSLKPLHESEETYVWCLLPDGEGNLYAGTGNHGIIYKIAADGTASVLYDSPELEIHSLTIDTAGNLYAGTSPNGIVYKIDPEGKASTLFDAEEKYILALVLDSKGNIYAATGDKCKVYRISSDGETKPVLDSSEYHALSLAADKDDNIYVGTGVDGIIYKISASGAVTILYDAAEDSITALAIDSKGMLFAGASPKGVLYELAPGGTPKVIYDKADKGILGLATDAHGNVYAVSASNVFKIMPDEKVCTLDNEHDLQFLSLAVRDGQLYAGTGNIGSVYRAEVGKVTEGTYESPVHDCELPSKWGIVEWNAELPKGASIVLRTRTGYVAEPDSTWSDWSAPYGTPGAKITSPPGRYIQYVATLQAEDTSASPKVKDVSIAYLPKNQAPKVTLTSPKGGEKWSGKRTMRWKGSDPDKDALSYEVFYSNDGGASWQPLHDKIVEAAPADREDEKPAEDADSAEDESAGTDSSDPQRILAEMAAELDKHPEIPEEVKDRILSEAPGMMEDQAQEATGEDSVSEEKRAGNDTKQTRFSWDTTESKDGTYLIKIVCCDRLSNPTDALTDEAVSESITVTNQAPEVVVFKKTLTVQADKSVSVEGFARQDLVGVAGVQYKIGSDDWASAAASDGIFDSGFESFTITTQPLSEGEHTIEVKAINQAGNSATTELTAKIE